MVLSKRERYIAIGVGAAIGLLLLDRIVLTPFDERSRAVRTARDEVAQRNADAELLFGRQHKLRTIWDELQKGGLKLNQSQAESQALQAILDWARAAGVELAGLKPERTTQEGQFQVISFNVTGTGSMASVSRLVWALETATIPVRVNEMQVTPRREGSDDLSVRLSVSALCMPPQPEAPKAGGETRGERS